MKDYPQRLRELAAKLDLIELETDADFATVDEVSTALRDFAARLDAKVTPELVDKACYAYSEVRPLFNGDSSTGMRAKDAARFGWFFNSRHKKTNAFSLEYLRGTNEGGFTLNQWRAAIDAAMAAPPSGAELAREGET
jgi:hypothetical protein